MEYQRIYPIHPCIYFDALCLIFKKIIETRLESRVSQAKNSDYVVPHKTYEQENA